MVEKGIKDETCHVIRRYAKANNKYIKEYDKNKESSYLNYWDVNNLHDRTMSQKLAVNEFEWIEETSEFKEDFIKNYNEQCGEGYFLEFDVQCPKKLQELHNDLLFVSERIELGKVEKLVTNLHNKNEYVVHKRNLKQALNHGLILKNVHRAIKFNRKNLARAIY